MPQPYTVDDALRDLAAVVAEAGDGHVYERHLGEDDCLYAWEGQPDCIVGHVFARHGLLSCCVELEGLAASTVVSVLMPNATHAAVRVLTAAQDVQDAGETWGEALVAAKEAAAS